MSQNKKKQPTNGWSACHFLRFQTLPTACFRQARRLLNLETAQPTATAKENNKQEFFKVQKYPPQQVGWVGNFQGKHLKKTCLKKVCIKMCETKKKTQIDSPALIKSNRSSHSSSACTISFSSAWNFLSCKGKTTNPEVQTTSFFHGWKWWFPSIFPL